MEGKESTVYTDTHPTTHNYTAWGGAEHHLAAPSFYTAPLPRQNVTNPPSPLLLSLFGEDGGKKMGGGEANRLQTEFGCLPE